MKGAQVKTLSVWLDFISKMCACSLFFFLFFPLELSLLLKESLQACCDICIHFVYVLFQSLNVHAGFLAEAARCPM